MQLLPLAGCIAHCKIALACNRYIAGSMPAWVLCYYALRTGHLRKVSLLDCRLAVEMYCANSTVSTAAGLSLSCFVHNCKGFPWSEDKNLINI